MTNVIEEQLYERIISSERHKGCLRNGDRLSILGHYLDLYGVEWDGDRVKSIRGDELRCMLGHMPPSSVMPEYWPGNLLAALNESLLSNEECVQFLKRMKEDVRIRIDLKRVLNLSRPHVVEVRTCALRELLAKPSPAKVSKKRVRLDGSKLKALASRK